MLFAQQFLENEIVYDFDEPDCDTLYFIESGKVQVQAKVTTTHETVVPISKDKWEKTTKETDVHYFVRQIDSGDYFGLEELVDIGLLKLEDSHDRNRAAKLVKRQLRVTTMSNCTLLYMTKSAFLQVFGKYQLQKIKEFSEPANL